MRNMRFVKTREGGWLFHASVGRLYFNIIWVKP